MTAEERLAGINGADLGPSFSVALLSRDILGCAESSR
jgi:hypothetical protein